MKNGELRNAKVKLTHTKKRHKQKGITIVSLVITIILLLILATISLQAITQTGLFKGASQAKKEAKRAQVTEWLNLKLMEEQMYNPTGTEEEIIEATRATSYGNAELAKMGKTVVVDENTSTIEDGKTVAVYFYVQVDQDIYKVEMAGAKFIGEAGEFPPIGSVPELAEGDIIFTYTVDGQEIDKETWTNKSVTVTASTEITGYTLHTSKDGKTWYDVRSQTFTENGKIYVALYDGTNYQGAASANVTNIDTDLPKITAFDGNPTLTGLNLNIGCSDADSGIDEIEWHYEARYKLNWNVIEDGSYKFEYDGQKWVSNNKNVDESTAITTWKLNLTQDTTVSFAYKVSSETRYDKLTIILDDSTIVDAISGNLEEQTYETQLTAGEHTLVAKYIKDNSTSSYDDCAYILFNTDTLPEVNIKETITDKITEINSGTISRTKTIETAAIPEPYKAYVIVRDKAGNQITSSTKDILDEIDPSASINLSGTNTDTVSSITAEVVHTDNESGVKIESCKWVYNKTSSAIGTDESNYTGGTFSSNPETIELIPTTAGTYYLHVLTIDNGGNKKETISNSVTVVSNISKLANAVNIGDYVAYDATNNYSYKSEKGTGSSHGNGCEDQTFTSSSDIKWRVLSKDTSTGEVVLISEANVGRIMIGEAIGYLYAEQELNEICKIYGHGIGANTGKTFNYVTGDLIEGTKVGTITGSGARSINVDDINKICNVTPSTLNSDYGTASYTKNIYHPTISQEDGKSTSAASRSDVYTSYSYTGSTYLTSTEEPYKMLFRNTEDTKNIYYWLASRCVESNSENSEFNVFNVSSGEVRKNYLFHGGETNHYSSNIGSGIRPVVYLKSSIHTSGKNSNGQWEISPDLTTEDITFTYTVDGQEINKETWTNKEVTVTASTTIEGYTVQTKKEDGSWTDKTSQTFTENGQIYAVLYDGTNYGGAATGNVTNIDTTKPIITGATSTTNSIAITATDEASGIVGYAVTESDTEPSASNFTAVESTKSFSTTVTGKTQGTTYYVWVKDAAGNISESKNTNTDTVTSGTTTGAITFGTTTWSGGKASTTISTNTSYTIQYQVNSISESGWTTGTSVTGLLHNDKLYARLWDETNAGEASAAHNILDGTDPSASIELSATTVGKTKSITATVTHTDNESGINITNCKWVYNTVAGEIGTNASSYTGGTFSSNGQTITLSTTTEGTYYLHVLTTDVAGRKVETISNAIAVLEPLANKVSIGDYVAYTPDTANTDAIITEFGEYLGVTANTTSKLTQETGLKWRVLDVVDGNVRLISATPTTSEVVLSGYNGYNNAVYLLDKTCKTLYSKAGYSENVQSLKIEDIQKYMTITDYSTINSDYGQPFTPKYKKYPSIFAQEAGQTVDGKTGTLGLSEQETPIKQTTTNIATSWTVKETSWFYRSTAKSDFTNEIYYNLFINNGNGDFSYWMSSRCNEFDSRGGSFGVRYVSSSWVTGYAVYFTDGSESYFASALRPVITLNSNVLVKSGEGTPESAYEI